MAHLLKRTNVMKVVWENIEGKVNKRQEEWMDRIIDSVQDKNSKGIKNRKVMNVSGKYLDKIKYND